MTDLHGLITCARYAFPPNQLQYCGPLKTKEIQAYLRESVSDENLSQIISQFETLYPYLAYISHEHGISDPFDHRVVEAYWVGNDLLSQLSQKSLYDHFTDSLSLKKRMSIKELKWLIGKIPQGALAHHTFHVLNVFTRTGHHSVKHTIDTMDSCRIGWGRLISIKGSEVVLRTKRLILHKGKLALGPKKKKQLRVASGLTLFERDIGRIYTYHWDTICDKITSEQAKNLISVTHSAIRLANLTI